MAARRGSTSGREHPMPVTAYTVVVYVNAEQRTKNSIKRQTEMMDLLRQQQVPTEQILFVDVATDPNRQLWLREKAHGGKREFPVCFIGNDYVGTLTDLQSVRDSGDLPSLLGRDVRSSLMVIDPGVGELSGAGGPQIKIANVQVSVVDNHEGLRPVQRWISAVDWLIRASLTNIIDYVLPTATMRPALTYVPGAAGAQPATTTAAAAAAVSATTTTAADATATETPLAVPFALPELQPSDVEFSVSRINWYWRHQLRTYRLRPTDFLRIDRETGLVKEVFLYSDISHIVLCEASKRLVISFDGTSREAQHIAGDCVGEFAQRLLGRMRQAAPGKQFVFMQE